MTDDGYFNPREQGNSSEGTKKRMSTGLHATPEQMQVGSTLHVYLSTLLNVSLSLSLGYLSLCSVNSSEETKKSRVSLR